MANPAIVVATNLAWDLLPRPRLDQQAFEDTCVRVVDVRHRHATVEATGWPRVEIGRLENGPGHAEELGPAEEPGHAPCARRTGRERARAAGYALPDVDVSPGARTRPR